MRTLHRLLAYTFVFLLSACQSLESPTTSAPKLRQAVVGGVTLNYLEQGQGAAVVFVHGAFSDHRVWESQRTEISRQYRYIALDQRYFGSAPWSDSGTKYSVATHANDLAGDRKSVV